MPKVTSIEPQKRNPRRFNIYLDGQFAFGADEDLVVNRRLVAGKEILPEDLDKILFEAEVGKLMGRMYRLFNIRQRSEKEVRDYLKIKNQISDLVIETLVDTLKRKGMINDLEFAKAWVEARKKRKGKIVIKLELQQKGISKEIIEEALSLVINEERVAKEALEKKIRHWKNLSNMEFRRKATDFLMRRGFEYEVVKQVVEKFLQKD